MSVSILEVVVIVIIFIFLVKIIFNIQSEPTSKIEGGRSIVDPDPRYGKSLSWKQYRAQEQYRFDLAGRMKTYADHHRAEIYDPVTNDPYAKWDYDDDFIYVYGAVDHNNGKKIFVRNAFHNLIRTWRNWGPNGKYLIDKFNKITFLDFRYPSHSIFSSTSDDDDDVSYEPLNPLSQRYVDN